MALLKKNKYLKLDDNLHCISRKHYTALLLRHSVVQVGEAITPRGDIYNTAGKIMNINRRAKLSTFFTDVMFLQPALAKWRINEEHACTKYNEDNLLIS